MELKDKLVDLSDQSELFRKMKLYYWRIKNCIPQAKIERGIRKRKKGKLNNNYIKMKEYQNIHRGQRCFIIAMGPSLTLSDLEMLKHEITFGMNSIVKVFKQTEWRPTYYGIQDRQVYEKLEETILSNFSDQSKVFVADELAHIFNIPNYFCKFPYNGNYHIYVGDYNDYSAKFSDNAYEVVYDGYSITYSLIQIAVYMGFTEIYLLGADSTYGQGENNHFVESGFVDKNAYTSFNRLMTGYEKAKEYADVHDIKIYNATRGGALEIYPRVNLEEIIIQ